MSTFSNVWIDLLHDHRQAEEQSSSNKLLSKNLISVTFDSKLLTQELSLALNNTHKLIINFSQALLDTINN
jgi:hypothetical protein